MNILANSETPLHQHANSAACPPSPADGEPAPHAHADPETGAAIDRISRRLGNVTTQAFLPECAAAFRDELQADYLLIGRMNPFSNMMRTLSFVGRDGPLENFVYSLDGTPCRDTVNNGLCFHTDNVAQAYPYDRDLVDMNLSSYAGARLSSADGDVLGVLVAMWETPLRRKDVVLDLMTHFRDRIGGVIDATERVARYSWAIEKVFGGVWEWDLRTGGTTLSHGMERLLCAGSDGKGPYDLARIEKTIHPEDRGRHVSAMQRHLNDGVPYDIRLRLRGPNGDYRWFVSRGDVIRDADGKPERMIGGFCDIHDAVVTMRKTGRV